MIFFGDILKKYNVFILLSIVFLLLFGKNTHINGLRRLRLLACLSQGAEIIPRESKSCEEAELEMWHWKGQWGHLVLTASFEDREQSRCPSNHINQGMDWK